MSRDEEELPPPPSLRAHWAKRRKVQWRSVKLLMRRSLFPPNELHWLAAIYPCKWSRMILRKTLPFRIVCLFNHHIPCLGTLPLILFLDFGCCLVDLGIHFGLWDLCFGFWIRLSWTCFVFFLTWETGLIGSCSGSLVGNPGQYYLGLVKPQ